MSGKNLQPIRVKARRLPVIALAVLLLAAGPAHALEYKQEGKIILASLSVSASNEITRNHPSLFGASEQRYSDLSAFTKWTGVLERFKKDFPKSVKQQHVRNWMKFLDGMKGASDKEKIAAVNGYMNKVQFSADKENYGANDYWATPMEFLKRGKGDCEDYAIAKYISLRALGFAEEDMRLAIVYDHVMRMPHAILVVYHDDGISVLDNQNPDIVDASDISRYKPIYSISQLAWWRH